MFNFRCIVTTKKILVAKVDLAFKDEHSDGPQPPLEGANSTSFALGPIKFIEKQSLEQYHLQIVFKQFWFWLTTFCYDGGIIGKAICSHTDFRSTEDIVVRVARDRLKPGLFIGFVFISP